MVHMANKVVLFTCASSLIVVLLLRLNLSPKPIDCSIRPKSPLHSVTLTNVLSFMYNIGGVSDRR